MTYAVVYGEPTVLAVRGLGFDEAVARALRVAREGRPDVRVVDDGGNTVRKVAVQPDSFAGPYTRRRLH